MKKNITIRKLDEKGDTAVIAKVGQIKAVLEKEQGKGNYIYIPESKLGVFTPKDKLPRIQEGKMEILVFPPVMGG